MTHGSNEVVSSLRTILAETFVLYANTHAAHWNVTGPDFAALHEFFGTQYEELHASVDDIAERLRALDTMAPVGLADLTSGSKVTDGLGTGSATDILKKLITAHDVVIKSLENGIEAADDADDVGTEDLLTQRLQAHQKSVWMLKAHLG